MADSETAFKWWLRYIVVPLIGSGGVAAIIIALMSGHKDREPSSSSIERPAAIGQDSSKTTTSSQDVPRHPMPKLTAIVDGLRWTIDDNGSEIDWGAANAYCGGLNLDGLSGWRLPSIKELRGLAEASSSDYDIRKPFRLTGPYVWSSERRGDDVRIYYFASGTGEVGGSVYQRYRVLCVRSEAKPGDK